MWVWHDFCLSSCSGIIALNALVFCCWRVPALQRSMVTYFTSNPASSEYHPSPPLYSAPLQSVWLCEAASHVSGHFSKGIKTSAKPFWIALQFKNRATGCPFHLVKTYFNEVFLRRGCLGFASSYMMSLWVGSFTLTCFCGDNADTKIWLGVDMYS